MVVRFGLKLNRAPPEGNILKVSFKFQKFNAGAFVGSDGPGIDFAERRRARDFVGDTVASIPVSDYGEAIAFQQDGEF